MTPAAQTAHRFRALGRCSLLLLLLLALLSPVSLKAASRVTAALDRASIALGESAVLTLSFEGDAPGEVPAITAPAGLTVRYAGESRSFRIDNGRSSSAVILSYQLTPSQPGEYSIPSFKIPTASGNVATQPLTLKVAKAGEAGDNGLAKVAFLKLVTPKTNVFIGEIFPVEIQLYVTAGKDLQMPQLQGEGFVFGKIPQPTQTRVQLNNTIYNVVTFKLSAAAAKNGSLNLGPAQCSLTVQVQQQARRSRDIFDEFMDPFSGRGQFKAVTLSSDPLKIEVQPLPNEGRPAGFSGAVGRFTFTGSAGPTNVTVGDPITLKYQVSGAGALDNITLPPQDDWTGFKIYPATSSVELSDPTGLSGIKSFEQVIIPQSAEANQIPAVRFSYFDPEERRYHTINQPPVPLVVTATGSGAPQPVVYANAKPEGAAAPAPETRDIVHIKPTLGALAATPTSYVLQPWFWGLQAVPVCAWLAAILWRKREASLAANPRLRRRKLVADLTSSGIRELSTMARARNSDGFFAAVFRLLQEQIGERLDLPASAITESILDEAVAPAGGSEQLIRALHELFGLCNMARYAPVRSESELSSIVPKVESALAELRRLPDPKSRK